MSELGQHLKEIREQKNITLDDLQRTTKIQKRYLIAIEEGHYDRLPGQFYARAFIKTYAESIGLDPEELFDQFKSELPNPQQETVQLPSRTKRSNISARPTKRSKSQPVLTTILTIVILAIIAIAATIIIQNYLAADGAEQPDMNQNVEGDFYETEEDGDSDVSGDEEDEGNEDELVEDEPEPDPIELNFVETQGITSFYELHGALFEHVRIEMDGTSYIDIQNGLGRTLYMSDTGEDIEFDFSEEEELIFNFGRSTDVQLFIDDQPVDFQTDSVHQKIHITISDFEE
ncbi:helix-turn-helix domain-containing protein [Alkalihalobacillus hemicellulosilyticus]|uniref:Transcriptional regulator in cluster with unspecified monosaccharide ABC transport system n=1 Tax=Halalkalibacter hemicellulosilyticusJCM 9152 TaxID=1236971 RepID=W4QFG1_9BACI|nr:transcriptional regulator in cluster with unspecified monosaccharide ABC transport system [Halalkalibacter hemicellulosilyticusJCM 9152]